MNILLCDSPEHADLVDHLIMERLRDVEGARGGSWSGVFVDYGTPERYAVLWDAPAAALFGQPEDDPELVIVEGEMIVRDAEGQFVSGNWEIYAPEPE